MSKLFYGAALLAVICTPAMAQNMTLGKGQMLKVAPNGQITITSMPTGAKMTKAMHRGKAMSGGFVVWMDDSGHLRMSDASIFIQDLRQRESN
jgi:hypothetical protein